MRAFLLAAVVLAAFLAVAITDTAATSPHTAALEPTGPTGKVVTETCRKISASKWNHQVRKERRLDGRSRALRHKPVCRRTFLKYRRHVRAIEGRCERKGDPGCRWLRQWRELSKYDQTWALRIGSCESGNNPRTDTGNGFLGAHQWVLSTWHAAGGAGSPVDASWYEQAVRAVRWRNRAGTMQWPACSKRLGYA